MRYGSVCGLSQGCWLRIKKVPGRPLRYAVTLERDRLWGVNFGTVDFSSGRVIR